MTTVIREESALKGKSPTQKAKLIDKLVDGETAQLAKKVEEFRGRWGAYALYTSQWWS